MLPGIQKALEDRARDFVSKLGISPNDISDIRIVGGNASYAWSPDSDLDVTIMLDRNKKLTKDDVRRIGISASNLSYRVDPTIEGVDLNFYIGHRNLGGLRPAKQSVYSLNKGFIVGPGMDHEREPNYLAGRANAWAELIESCMNDESDEADSCAEKLLKRLKRYRLSGLKSEQGEYSTPNMVWRLLSRSGYIQTLKSKIEQMEKDYYRVKNPSLIRNEEFRVLVKDGAGINTIPSSLLKWHNKLLAGASPIQMITRMMPILNLLTVSEIPDK